MIGEKAKITVFRYNPEEDESPYYKVYEVPFESGMTVLDTLNYIYKNYDGSLAYVYGCRYGFCGSCALKVNGKPTLICRELATKEMKIEPLENFPVVRDLVIDREGLEGKIRGIRPFLERVTLPDKEPEVLKPANFETFRLVSRCVGCFACISSCPVTTADSYKFPGPSLLTELARYFFDPRDEGDRTTTAYFEGLFYCAGCRKCEEVCPYEISVPELIVEPLREQAVSRNIEPSVVKEEVRHILSTGNTLPSIMEKYSLIKKLSPLEKAKDENATVVFFVWCYVDQDFRLHQAGKSAIEILKRNNISVAIPKDQVCCGRPLLESGENKKVEELVRKNVLAIESTGIREVVTVCPGCGLTLKEDYPLIFSRIEGRKPNFEVYDFSEYLVNKIKLDGKLHKLDLEVTYHDPCHLNRGQGIHEQPRQIINSIPGVKLLEMEESDRCCAGGLIKAIDSQLAQIIAKRKAEIIKNLNVKTVITPCPICVLQINQSLKLSKVRGVKVMHLTELLDKAL